MFKLYKLSKPLLILIVSLIITYKWEYLPALIQELLNLPSELFAYGITLTVITTFLTLLIGLVEYCIGKKIGIMDVSLLNENKLAGTTPLYLTKDKYEKFYIRLKVNQHNRKIRKGNMELTLVFPLGITVDIEDDYKIFGKTENKVTVTFKDLGLNSKEDYRIIPIIVARGSQYIDGNTTIQCENNLRFFNIFTYIKYHYRKISLEEND